MAVVSSSNVTLKIDNLFLDGDTRTITLKNPKSNITLKEITDLNSFLQEKNALLGDKDQSGYGKIRKVTRITTNTDYIGYSEE